MSFKWGQLTVERGVKNIVWLREQVAEDYRRRRIADKRNAYLGEGLRDKLDTDPEALPDGSYPLLGVDGDTAVYYSFAQQRGVKVPVGSIRKYMGHYSYEKKDGIPNSLLKEKDETPAEPRTGWAAKR